MKDKYDFSGWATKNDLECADGRVIRKNAFKESDGKRVSLVWQHLHDSPDNVLGHAILENREDGVYAYGFFNETESGKQAKSLVMHHDITNLSIYANNLVQKSSNVIHGVIREVSLVMSAANPGAKIEFVTMAHSDELSDDEAVIWTGAEIDLPKAQAKKEELSHADDEDSSEETVGEIFNTLSDKQKDVVYAMIATIADAVDEDSDDEASHSDLDEGETMKRNVFDSKNEADEHKLIHLTQEQFNTIKATAMKNGSFRDAVIEHAGTYGIDNISYLFPDAKSVTPTPDWVTRDMSWVMGVINGCRHSRFSRIKSLSADITPDAARALGYVTGALKKEEVFALQKRETTPQTVYKKQKLDRDDILDITDMDVVAWMKAEMRVMLNEEIARAVLVGDGRDPVADAADKIVETKVRPIYKDDANMYVHSVRLVNTATIAQMEEALIRGRASYKGSGNPVMYAGGTFITDLLLQKDTTGRRYYITEAELASALRVSRIVEVPVMEGLNRDSTQTAPINMALKAIIVNLNDYVIGADKGGEINMFEDFDIDYNQEKYLLETRISGALVKPKSAIVVEVDTEVDTN